MTDATTSAPAQQPTAQPASTPTTTQTSQPNAATGNPATEQKQGDAAQQPAVEQAQLLFDEGQPEGQGDATTDGADKPKEGEADPNAPVEVKLEELAVPDDMPIPDDMKAPLTEFIAENKMSKEQAQKVIDLGVKMQQQNLDIWTKTKGEWRKAAESDPEIGGANLKPTLNRVNNAIRKFAGNETQLKEFQQDLILLGLGNKPSFIRFMNNVAKATGNDSAAGNSGGGAPNGDDFEAKAKRMYPNMA